MDDKRGILIGGHYVVDGFISDLDQTIPTNIEINNQVLEVDIEDKSKWNISKVPLKKVCTQLTNMCYPQNKYVSYLDCSYRLAINSE